MKFFSLPSQRNSPSKTKAFTFVVLLGFALLFLTWIYPMTQNIAFTHSANRGINFDGLRKLTGVATMIQFILFLCSGILVDKMGRHWIIMISGLVLPFSVLPFLYLYPGSALLATSLILSYAGSALQAPARSVLVAAGATTIGPGLRFGLQEECMQLGYFLATLTSGLFFPSLLNSPGLFWALQGSLLLSIILLFVSRKFFLAASKENRLDHQNNHQPIPRKYFLFLIPVFLMALTCPPITFFFLHFAKISSAPVLWFRIFLGGVMVGSIISALLCGHFFDKKGSPVLMIAIPLSACSFLFLFRAEMILFMIGGVLFGIGLGVQYSVFRAAVANLVSANRRGLAYGIFFAVIQLGNFLSLLGAEKLSNLSFTVLIGVLILFQLSTLPWFYMLRISQRTADANTPPHFTQRP